MVPYQLELSVLLALESELELEDIAYKTWEGLV